MEKNIGAQDKKIRLAAAGVCALIALFASLHFLWLIAVILAATSLMNFCPAYLLLGKNTCGATSEDSCCGGSCHGDDKTDKAEEKAESAEKPAAKADKKDDDKAA